MGIMFVQCDKQQSQKTIKNRTVWARLKSFENVLKYIGMQKWYKWMQLKNCQYGWELTGISCILQNE